MGYVRRFSRPPTPIVPPLPTQTPAPSSLAVTPARRRPSSPLCPRRRPPHGRRGGRMAPNRRPSGEGRRTPVPWPPGQAFAMIVRQQLAAGPAGLLAAGPAGPARRGCFYPAQAL